MTTPTTEQIAKLPKWAQEHINQITRLKERAEAQVKRFIDEQTPSPIYVDEWHSNPRIKRFVRCDHTNLVIEHAGVSARIHLASNDDGQRLHGIEITYEAMHGLNWKGVSIVPRGPSNIQIVHKDNL